MNHMPVVELTHEQQDALLAALDGYVAEPCWMYHGDYSDPDHGDESECDGWGPQGLHALNSAHYALMMAARNREQPTASLKLTRLAEKLGVTIDSKRYDDGQTVSFKWNGVTFAASRAWGDEESACQVALDLLEAVSGEDDPTA